MIQPGWYHAEGDPVGSQRYWDGTQWQGDARMPPSHDPVVYYEPAESQVDLGGVATLVPLHETDPSRLYAQSPYSVSTATVNVARRKPLPENLKNLTVLVGALKAIPLAFLAFSTVSVLSRSALTGRTGGRFAPPGLDFNAGFGVAIFVTVAFLALGLALLVTQTRAALNDHAANLFAIGLIMLVLDILNTVTQWDRYSQGLSATPTLLATITLGLQGLVTLWSGVQSRLT